MNKRERKAAAIKKAKRKKMIFIIASAAVVVVIAALVIINALHKSKTRVFTDGHQTITLSYNGSFTAELAHEKRNGTYTESTANGVTTVTFIINGVGVDGSIADNTLTLPEEWQDDHGHGDKLQLK